MLAFIILSIAMVSCYDKYIVDNTYAGIYFPYHIDVRTIVVGEGMKIENMLFGNYWHGGAAVITRAGKPDSTVVYKTTIPTAETNIWVLTTIGPNTLVTNGYANAMTSKQELKLVYKNGNIYVSAGPTASFPFAKMGTSKYNKAKLLQN